MKYKGILFLSVLILRVIFCPFSVLVTLSWPLAQQSTWVLETLKILVSCLLFHIYGLDLVFFTKYRVNVANVVNFTFFAGHRRGIRRPLKCGEISQSQSHLRYEDLRKDILLDGTIAWSHEGLGRCHIHRSRRISRVPMKYKLSNRARRAL